MNRGLLLATAGALAGIVLGLAGPAAACSPAREALGLPPVPAGPVPGYVLIADRNNNRLLIVSPAGKIVWRFPRAGDLRPGEPFTQPDDAFFAPGYRRISTNEEFADRLAEIDIRRHRIVWSFGRPGVLAHPDDAYALANGVTQVADLEHCRIVRIDRAGQIVWTLGSASRCVHDPPRSLHSPNGATPLLDGGTLVTEIGGWVDRIDARGRLVYTIRTPTAYPSDAQLLPDGNILVAGFNTPGRVDEITRSGRMVWTYGPASGPGALDRPSLAVRWPNGMIAITDDWHHRIVVVDPRTRQIVWQYGHLGVPSAADGYLSKPDGLDLLPASVLRDPAGLAFRRIGSLPEATSRMAAVALPDGRVLALGGLTSRGSSRLILLGPPGRLRPAGRLPVPTHDAAAVLLDGAAYLLGGGEQVSTPAVVRIDPATGAARSAGRLDEPLSDLGAVAIGRDAFLVGGYTGTKYASAVLRFRPGSASTTTVARLPAGLRYAGVATLGGRIYVAGGVTTQGESDAVLEVDPGTGAVRRIATLPQPVAHAALVAFRGSLYLIGGSSPEVLRISPSGSVSRAGTLPHALADPAAVALRKVIVVLGGAGSNAVYELRP